MYPLAVKGSTSRVRNGLAAPIAHHTVIWVIRIRFGWVNIFKKNLQHRIYIVEYRIVSQYMVVHAICDTWRHWNFFWPPVTGVLWLLVMLTSWQPFRILPSQNWFRGFRPSCQENHGKPMKTTLSVLENDGFSWIFLQMFPKNHWQSQNSWILRSTSAHAMCSKWSTSRASRASASVIIFHAPSRDPRWLVYFMENPIKMDAMGYSTPIFLCEKWPVSGILWNLKILPFWSPACVAGPVQCRLQSWPDVLVPSLLQEVVRKEFVTGSPPMDI